LWRDRKGENEKVGKSESEKNTLLFKVLSCSVKAGVNSALVKAKSL
jgi:hypothetical protein